MTPVSTPYHIMILRIRLKRKPLWRREVLGIIYSTQLCCPRQVHESNAGKESEVMAFMGRTWLFTEPCVICDLSDIIFYVEREN